MYQRIRQSAIIIAFGGALLAAASFPAAAQSSDAGAAAPVTSVAQATQSAPTGQQGNWLSLREVYDKLEAAGYSDIREIERERSGYEAKARDRDGRRVKLQIEPLSGKVIHQKVRSERDDD